MNTPVHCPIFFLYQISFLSHKHTELVEKLPFPTDCTDWAVWGQLTHTVVDSKETRVSLPFPPQPCLLTLYVHTERGGGGGGYATQQCTRFVREEVEEKDVLYTYSCVSPLLSSLVAFLSATPLPQRERERRARPVVYASTARRDSGVQTFRVGRRNRGDAGSDEETFAAKELLLDAPDSSTSKHVLERHSYSSAVASALFSRVCVLLQDSAVRG